jgi:hypothetical protein
VPIRQVESKEMAMPGHATPRHALWRILARTTCLCVLIALSLLPPTGAGPGVALAGAQDNDDAAWATIRAQFPPEVPVYRPTWLPTRVQTPVRANVLGESGAATGVDYGSPGSDNFLFFTIGPANSPFATSFEPIVVHGLPGTLSFYSGDGSRPPMLAVYWGEAGESYSIRWIGNPTRDEFLQVVDRLAPAGADGRVAPRCFAETGRCVGGRFLAYWLARGGLAVNGYPLSGEFRQVLEDGREYTVQYFERVRLELHPANQPPYDVLLGQFGRRILLARPDGQQRLQPAEPAPDARYFPESGHTLGGRFLEYWEANGGLPQFGFPLTEPFEERLEDGAVYLVQYFERARFEYHPENALPEDVQLGQFGRRILAESGR